MTQLYLYTNKIQQIKCLNNLAKLEKLWLNGTNIEVNEIKTAIDTPTLFNITAEFLIYYEAWANLTGI